MAQRSQDCRCLCRKDQRCFESCGRRLPPCTSWWYVAGDEAALNKMSLRPESVALPGKRPGRTWAQCCISHAVVKARDLLILESPPLHECRPAFNDGLSLNGSNRFWLATAKVETLRIQTCCLPFETSQWARSPYAHKVCKSPLPHLCALCPKSTTLLLHHRVHEKYS